MSTSTDVARRSGSAPAQAAPAALAIQPGQVTWDKFQDAALNQLGLREASNGDRAVFLHVSQRTGLDPFARQIYMIGRPDKNPDGSWGKKWTIQTGIDGWRVVRARAERAAGVRGILGRAVFYDWDGNETKVWVRPEPPAACEITYTVREHHGDTPYTSVLRYDEYVQTTKEGKPAAQWAVKPAHMLEKCTEADVYRKAFPQDFSGIQLDDAMPPQDPDAPPAAPERQRVTAGQLRGRTDWQGHAERGAQRFAQQRATAEAIETAAPGTGAAAEEALEAIERDIARDAARPAPPASDGQVGMIRSHFEGFGWTGSDEDRVSRLSATAQLAGYDGDLMTTKDLTAGQAAQAIRELKKCRSAQELLDLLADGEVPGE